MTQHHQNQSIDLVCVNKNECKNSILAFYQGSNVLEQKNKIRFIYACKLFCIFVMLSADFRL